MAMVRHRTTAHGDMTAHAGRLRGEEVSAVLYSGLVPTSIHGTGIGDGWYPAWTTADPEVRDAIADRVLSITGRR